MKQKTMIFAGLTLAVVISLAAFAWAEEKEDDDDEKEETVELAKVPPMVRSALEKYAAGGQIKEVGVEKDDGVTYYEADYEVSGVEHSVKVTEAGDLVEMEQKIEAASLPAAAAAAIGKKYPGSKIEGAESVQITIYEVAIQTKKGKKKEVKVFASGAEVEEND